MERQSRPKFRQRFGKPGISSNASLLRDEGIVTHCFGTALSVNAQGHWENALGLTEGGKFWLERHYFFHGLVPRWENINANFFTLEAHNPDLASYFERKLERSRISIANDRYGSKNTNSSVPSHSPMETWNVNKMNIKLRHESLPLETG